MHAEQSCYEKKQNKNPKHSMSKTIVCEFHTLMFSLDTCSLANTIFRLIG